MAFNTYPRFDYGEEQHEGFFERDPPNSMQQSLNGIQVPDEPHPGNEEIPASARLQSNIIFMADRLQVDQEETFAALHHRLECKRVKLQLHEAYERMERAQNSVHEFHYYLNELDHDIHQANWDPLHRAKVHHTLDYTIGWLEDAYANISEEFLAAFEHFGRCNDEYEAIVGGDGKWLFEDRETTFY